VPEMTTTEPTDTGFLSAISQREGGVAIELEGVSKTYPGQSAPAVEDFSMRIEPGELVMFVGPSGCGKTTTMKMINRIIEPSTGRILVGGDDVTDVDPTQLRRRIGYVIQNVGLFPHQSIRTNVATVPRLLGWDKKRTRDRVEELLSTVGLDPATFGDRYPHQLSGGQRQRAGAGSSGRGPRGRRARAAPRRGASSRQR